MRVYFLTGATGAVGSAVVPLLLEDPEASVHLLLRAESDRRLDERLQSLFAFWGIDAEEDERRHRVHALRGDVIRPRLGLDRPVYDRLSATCTHIVHCAGQVRMTLPLDEARRHSVDAARRVIALGAACQDRGRLQKIEFVSTVGVAGRTQGLLEETWVTVKREFHNTYEAAKAEAEVYVVGKIAEGLPITVHRPSMVVGDAGSGRIIHFQVFYHLCEFLSGRRSWGLCPSLGASRLDTVPVDYVAAAILWSSQRRDTTGEILHLCSGPDQAIPLMELRDLVRDTFVRAGLRIPRATNLPPALFGASLPVLAAFAPERQRRALRTLPIFLDYLEDKQAFGNEKTQALLGAAGISLPGPSQYLVTVLGYYLANTLPV